MSLSQDYNVSTLEYVCMCVWCVYVWCTLHFAFLTSNFGEPYLRTVVLHYIVLYCIILVLMKVRWEEVDEGAHCNE